MASCINVLVKCCCGALLLEGVNLMLYATSGHNLHSKENDCKEGFKDLKQRNKIQN